jgi:hypothetical protein
MKKHIYLLFLIGFTSSLSAQAEDTVKTQNGQSEQIGEVLIVMDSSIDEVIAQYIQFNNSSQGVEGFRVQIYNDSGNNARSRSMEVKEAFESAFPNIPAHVQYQQPNFKVRVGDCRTKLEARRIQKEISNKYPDAFIVKDWIKK